MAGFALLNGSDASIDVSFGATPVSVKCIFNRWRAEVRRRFTEATSFCSGGWVQETPGMKQIIITLSGYASVGNAYSDPLALFASNTAVAFVLSAFTGATLTGVAHAETDATEIVAAANSGRDIQLRSYGSVASVWPVT